MEDPLSTSIYLVPEQTIFPHLFPAVGLKLIGSITSRFNLRGQVLRGLLSQVPDLLGDVLLEDGSGAGELDEGDGGLVLVLVPGLYAPLPHPDLAVPAGRETASLLSHRGQLVVTGQEVSI